MAEERTNGHSESRMDRMEGLMEILIQDHLAFRDEHRQLLTAQVVLTDNMGKLAQRLEALTVRVDRLTESSQRSDERMDALISVVDGIVRGRPPQAPPG